MNFKLNNFWRYKGQWILLEAFIFRVIDFQLLFISSSDAI